MRSRTVEAPVAFLSLGPRATTQRGVPVHNSAEIFAYILRGVRYARVYIPDRRANFIRACARTASFVCMEQQTRPYAMTYNARD